MHISALPFLHHGQLHTLITYRLLTPMHSRLEIYIQKTTRDGPFWYLNLPSLPPFPQSWIPIGRLPLLILEDYSPLYGYKRKSLLAQTSVLRQVPTRLDFLLPRYGQSDTQTLHSEPALTRYSALSIFTHKSLWTQKYFSSFQPRFRLDQIHTSITLALIPHQHQLFRHNTQILLFVKNYLNLYFI